MNVSGEIAFRSSAEKVYEHLAWSVFAHAVGEPPQRALLRSRITLLTRYETKLWRATIVTTEEASLVPDERITWKHVDGPLTGSEETFALRAAPNGGTIVAYTGEIRARNRWLRGFGERVFVGPMTRRVSMAALEQARREVDGA